MTKSEIKNVLPITNQHLFKIDVYDDHVVLEIYNNAENFFRYFNSWHVIRKNGLEEGIEIKWGNNHFKLPKVVDCYRLI